MGAVIPHDIGLLLDNLSRAFQAILADKFVGFYVHGSLAMSCFNAERSDVDFLVVVAGELDHKARREIIDLLIESSSRAPAKGIEMSIIKQSDLDHFRYPTPFELHFSNDHLDRYRTNPDYFCGRDEDPDLAAHLMITKERGICLLGKAIRDVIPDIPEGCYLKSIIHDSEWSLGNISRGPDVGEVDVPPYAVLNLCRVLAYVRDGAITSKREGGEWGLHNLPQRYRPLICQALNKYASEQTESVQAGLLKDFAAYAKSIFSDLAREH